MMWKANKDVIAEKFNEYGLGTIRQKLEDQFANKVYCIQPLTPHTCPTLTTTILLHATLISLGIPYSHLHACSLHLLLTI